MEQVLEEQVKESSIASDSIEGMLKSISTDFAVLKIVMSSTSCLIAYGAAYSIPNFDYRLPVATLH